MQRWEFDSIAQSVSCMSSWFSGTLSEQLLLKEHLYSTAGSKRESHLDFDVSVHITCSNFGIRIVLIIKISSFFLRFTCYPRAWV